MLIIKKKMPTRVVTMEIDLSCTVFIMQKVLYKSATSIFNFLEATIQSSPVFQHLDII